MFIVGELELPVATILITVPAVKLAAEGIETSAVHVPDLKVVVLFPASKIKFLAVVLVNVKVVADEAFNI
jgi:hypothetical protein